MHQARPAIMGGGHGDYFFRLRNKWRYKWITNNCDVCGLSSPSFELISMFYITPKLTDNASMRELVLHEHQQNVSMIYSCCKKDTRI